MKKLGLLVMPLLAVSFLTNCGGSSNSKEYTVFFLSNGGTSVEKQTIKENEKVNKPDNPTKNGYSFLKWCTDEALTIEYDFSTLVTSDFILYAKWSDAVTYSITYHMPEGASHNNPTSYTIESDTIALTNATVTKVGYEANGWHNGSATGEIVTTIPKGSTGNLELYTSATAITYTINYHMPDGASKGDNPVGYTIESDDITLEKAAKNGYEFDGWHIGSTTGKSITTIPKGSTGNLELYTSATATTYTINYHMPEDASKGSNPDSYTIESDDITLVNATKNGYTFDGWHVGSTTGELITSIPKGSTGDLELYTSEEIVTYTITYKNVVKDEHPNDPDAYTIKTETITLSTPNRDANWTFGGWYTDPEFTNKITSITKGSFGDLTLYAKMTYKETSLENLSWDDIKMISEKGGARATFGDPGNQTKTVTMNGAENQVRIIGYDYDVIVNSSNNEPQYAGITFNFVEVINDYEVFWNNKDGDQSTTHDFINKSNLNDCLKPNGDVYQMIPSELMSVIKTVNKKVDIHPENKWIEGYYNTQLFPLSYDETVGNDNGTYEFYKVKREISKKFPWLRSPDKQIGNDKYALLFTNSTMQLADEVNNKHSIIPAFCI